MRAKSKDLCICLFLLLLQFGEPILGQVVPGWIHTYNQLDLFDFSPSLELLLASNRNTHALEFFKIDKPVKFVPAGEAPFEGPGLMFIYTLSDVAGDAGVKRL